MNEKVSGTAVRGPDLSIVVLSVNDPLIAEIRIIFVRALVMFKIWNQHIVLSRQTWSLIALAEKLHCPIYWTNLEKIAPLLYLTARRNARKSLHVDISAKKHATRANADHAFRRLKSIVAVEKLPTKRYAIKVSRSLHPAGVYAEQP
jgi:hypothetical protein